VNISIKVDGQTVLNGDLIQLLFAQAFAQGLSFHPPEGSVVEILAVVNDRTWCSERITMEYDTDEG